MSQSLMVAATDYRDCFTKPFRPLPIVLGRMMANTPLGWQDRHALLGRLYSHLRPLDKIRCREELRLCRMAKRGQLEATVP